MKKNYIINYHSIVEPISNRSIYESGESAANGSPYIIKLPYGSGVLKVNKIFDALFVFVIGENIFYYFCYDMRTVRYVVFVRNLVVYMYDLTVIICYSPDISFIKLRGLLQSKILFNIGESCVIFG
jgi:hypothetical protein